MRRAPGRRDAAASCRAVWRGNARDGRPGLFPGSIGLMLGFPGAQGSGLFGHQTLEWSRHDFALLSDSGRGLLRLAGDVENHVAARARSPDNGSRVPRSTMTGPRPRRAGGLLSEFCSMIYEGHCSLRQGDLLMTTKRRRRHSPEQVTRKLRDADALLNADKDLASVLQSWR